MGHSAPTDANASLGADAHGSALPTAKHGKDGHAGAGGHMPWEGRGGWIVAFDRREDGGCGLRPIRHSRMSGASGSSGWSALRKRGKAQP